MKSKTIPSLQEVSAIVLVIIVGVVSPHRAFGQDLSAAQRSIWEAVESYWNTWKENTPEKLRPFYHKNHVHWGAVSVWPFSSATMDPPPSSLDGVGAVIESYELTLYDVKVWDNVAMAMYEAVATDYLDNAHRLRCTDIWIKESDKWQIIGSIRDSCSALPKCQSSVIEATNISQRYDELAPIGSWYGKRGMPYGDGRHPGIDYLVPVGTPIVAVSDGIILFIGEPLKDKSYGGGISVRMKHADDFFSVYAHLSKVYVTNGQHVKRGERLGLSGTAYPKHAELHFGLIKNDKKDSGLYFSQSYNPDNFWLGGKPQCFYPNKDYSKNSFKEITFPVECSKP